MTCETQKTLDEDKVHAFVIFEIFSLFLEYILVIPLFKKKKRILNFKLDDILCICLYFLLFYTKKKKEY